MDPCPTCFGSINYITVVKMVKCRLNVFIKMLSDFTGSLVPGLQHQDGPEAGDQTVITTKLI